MFWSLTLRWDKLTQEDMLSMGHSSFVPPGTPPELLALQAM